MRRAVNLLRAAVAYRRDAFDTGLRAAGFITAPTISDPGPGDVLLTWNRYGHGAELANHFESHGAAVLVVENCPLGNDFQGGSYSIARGHVALTGGTWPEGDASRWDGWGVELQPFREGGKEVVILGQRGIGHDSARSPEHWAESVRGRIGGRVRAHPGTGSAKPLSEDLKQASAVITWSSAAAIQALMLGIPVWHAHPDFVGAEASLSLAEWPGEPKRDEAARLAVMRRLAHAVWSLDEIRSGEPIARLARSL